MLRHSFFIMYEKYAYRLKRAILDGRKTAISRYHRIGEVGDTFSVDGIVFQITNIYQTDLMNVAQHLYKKEGFETDTQFYKFWGNHHPDYMEQSLTVWVTEFEKVQP